MKQQHLINTRGMSSAREMRKLRRDREVQRLRIQRKTKTDVIARDNRAWDDKPEFQFRDEDRDWRLRTVPCPICGTDEPYMRTFFDTNPQEPSGVFKKRFQVYCRNLGAPGITGCNHKTPVLDSAKAAVNHWKLIAAMSK